MKRLWAPWRMDYIRNKHEEGCFLCRILAGSNDRENLVLMRGTDCAVVLNRYPYNNGHLMICPYRHVDDVAVLTDAEHLETMRLLASATGILRKEMNAEGFNVGFNLGCVAGAGLHDHIHMHVVPRWQGDINYMPVIADTKVIPESLLELWDTLHPAFASGS